MSSITKRAHYCSEMEQTKKNQIVHFFDGGAIEVEEYEEDCSTKVTTFSGSVRHLHKVTYRDGSKGFITDEQVNFVEPKLF